MKDEQFRPYWDFEFSITDYVGKLVYDFTESVIKNNDVSHVARVMNERLSREARANLIAFAKLVIRASEQQ